MSDETTIDLLTKLPDPKQIEALARAYDKLAKSEKKASDNKPKDDLGRISGPRTNFSRAQQRYQAGVAKSQSSPGSISEDELSDLKRALDNAESRLKRLDERNLPRIEKTRVMPVVKLPSLSALPKPIRIPKPPNLPNYSNVRGVYSNFSNANSRYNEALDQFVAKPGSVSRDVLRDLKISRDEAARRVSKYEDGLKPKAVEPTKMLRLPKEPKQPAKPELNKALRDLISSSRFGGSNGGLMPLVSKGEGVVSAILGKEIGALAGPVGIATTAIIELGKEAYEFSKRAAESGQELSRVRFGTGGTTGESTRLQAYSRAIGVDLGSMAQGLNERIASDPMAMSNAARFGAYNISGPGGEKDAAKNLLKVVEGLRGISDEQQRFRIAQSLGVTEALPLTQVSNGTFRQLQSDANLSSRILDPEFQRQSAEFGAATGRVQGGGEAVQAALSKNFFPVIIPALNGIADAEYALAAWANGDIKTAATYGAKALQNLGISNTNAASNLLPSLGPKPFIKGTAGDMWGGSENSALNTNTMATNMLTKQMIALAKIVGSVGGGERSRSAVPSDARNPRFFSRTNEMNALHGGTL